MKVVSRKVLLALSLAGAFGLLSAAPSWATGHRDPKPPKVDKSKGKKHVPEFDAGSAGAGAALLLGGVLVLVERRRRARASEKI